MSISDGKTDPWALLAPLREARLRYWLRAVGSNATVEQAQDCLEDQGDYQDLASGWASLAPEEQQPAGVRLEGLLRAAAYATRPECQHCGECCRNAGPTLYPGDEALLLMGAFSRSALRTVRAGEEARSHHAGRRVVLEREQVTIQPGRDGVCRFWDRAARRCSIHDQRPAQCRAQQCWDTSLADALMERPGMTRLDLLREDDPLREAVLEHDGRCSPARLRSLAGEAIDDLRGEAAAALLELVAADLAAREDLVDRGLATAAELPFALGRPLEEMLPGQGLRVEYDEAGGANLAPSES